MRNFIITTISLICIITFGLLKNTWAGFIYFALVFSCAITLYWSVILLINYIKKYKKNIEEDYNLYIATLVNKSSLTLDDIERDKPRYLKKFKKSQWQDKGKEWVKIGLCFGIFIACFVLIFTI